MVWDIENWRNLCSLLVTSLSGINNTFTPLDTVQQRICTQSLLYRCWIVTSLVSRWVTSTVNKNCVNSLYPRRRPCIQMTMDRAVLYACRAYCNVLFFPYLTKSLLTAKYFFLLHEVDSGRGPYLPSPEHFMGWLRPLQSLGSLDPATSRLANGWCICKVR